VRIYFRFKDKAPCTDNTLLLSSHIAVARIEAAPHPPSKGVGAGSVSPSIVKRQAGGEITKLSLKSKHKTSSSPTHRRAVVEKEVPNPHDSIAVRYYSMTYH
jgi:hypothetical protein